MASPITSRPLPRQKGDGDTTHAASKDSTSNKIDSLELFIKEHNKAVDDSLRLDSINRKKANGIESPVNFTAKDSMVYNARTKSAFFYGESNVKYEDMDLQSERVSLSMD